MAYRSGDGHVSSDCAGLGLYQLLQQEGGRIVWDAVHGSVVATAAQAVQRGDDGQVERAADLVACKTETGNGR